MEAVASETCPGGEYRVQVTSKKHVLEQMNRYKDVLRAALDGQAEVPEDTKRILLQELLANFEAAVQDNVLVNGQTWEEAADEDEAVDLEDLLDDTIVATTRRRRTYPKKILPHVVHSLKAERKLLGLFEQTVEPQELVRDADQEDTMVHLSAAAPEMVKRSVQALQSLSAVQTRALGLRQVLSLQPSLATLQVHREVFGDGQSEGTAARRPIRRAVEEAAAAEVYVRGAKDPEAEADGQEV